MICQFSIYIQYIQTYIYSILPDNLWRAKSNMFTSTIAKILLFSTTTVLLLLHLEIYFQDEASAGGNSGESIYTCIITLHYLHRE